MSDFNEEKASTVFHSHRMSRSVQRFDRGEKKAEGSAKLIIDPNNSYSNNNNRFDMVSP